MNQAIDLGSLVVGTFLFTLLLMSFLMKLLWSPHYQTFTQLNTVSRADLTCDNLKLIWVIFTLHQQGKTILVI